MQLHNQKHSSAGSGHRIKTREALQEFRKLAEMVRTSLCWFLLVSVALLSFASQTNAQTVTSTECIDGTLFTLVSGDDSNFDSAVSKCAALDSTNDSVLAAIRNQDHLKAAVALAGSTGSSWIGLVDNDEGKSDTDRFRYISSDQSGLAEFVDVGSSNFPWGKSQPNSVFQRCVSLFALNNEGVLFNDDTCVDARRYICSSNCVLSTSPPTPPTLAPTPPTLAPTPPTLAPTPPTLAPTPPTLAPTAPTLAPVGETTLTPTTKSENSIDINAGIIFGFLLPIVALASLFAFMVIRTDDLRKRFGKSSDGSDDASTFKQELLTDIQNKNGALATKQANPDFSLDQFIKQGANVDYAFGKASAVTAVNPPSTKLKSEIPKPGPSANTLERKKKEKADEDEFEALIANNGKISTQAVVTTTDEEEFDALIGNKGKMPSVKVSKADEEEFEAILSGATRKKSRIPAKKAVSNNPGFKNNSPVPPPTSNEARPQSTYLKAAEENKNRKSIFRPSSAFLSKAKRDKAMKKGQEELRKKSPGSKKKFDIDSDI